MVSKVPPVAECLSTVGRQWSSDLYLVPGNIPLCLYSSTSPSAIPSQKRILLFSKLPALSCLILSSSLCIPSVAISLAMIRRLSSFGSDTYTSYIRDSRCSRQISTSSASAGRINERWEACRAETQNIPTLLIQTAVFELRSRLCV